MNIYIYIKEKTWKRNKYIILTQNLDVFFSIMYLFFFLLYLFFVFMIFFMIFFLCILFLTTFWLALLIYRLIKKNGKKKEYIGSVYGQAYEISYMGTHWKLHVQTLQEVFCYLIFVKGIETLRIFLVRNELLIN